MKDGEADAVTSLPAVKLDDNAPSIVLVVNVVSEIADYSPWLLEVASKRIQLPSSRPEVIPSTVHL
jgi:hypothetical protein